MAGPRFLRPEWAAYVFLLRPQLRAQLVLQAADEPAAGIGDLGLGQRTVEGLELDLTGERTLARRQVWTFVNIEEARLGHQCARSYDIDDASRWNGRVDDEREVLNDRRESRKRPVTDRAREMRDQFRDVELE